MNKAIYAVSALLALSALSACCTSQKKTEAAPQVVEFSEAEVPHILVTKKRRQNVCRNRRWLGRKGHY